ALLRVGLESPGPLRVDGPCERFDLVYTTPPDPFRVRATGGNPQPGVLTSPSLYRQLAGRKRAVNLPEYIGRSQLETCEDFDGRRAYNDLQHYRTTRIDRC